MRVDLIVRKQQRAGSILEQLALDRHIIVQGLPQGVELPVGQLPLLVAGWGALLTLVLLLRPVLMQLVGPGSDGKVKKRSRGKQNEGNTVTGSHGAAACVNGAAAQSCLGTNLDRAAVSTASCMCCCTLKADSSAHLHCCSTAFTAHLHHRHLGHNLPAEEHLVALL